MQFWPLLLAGLPVLSLAEIPPTASVKSSTSSGTEAPCHKIESLRLQLKKEPAAGKTCPRLQKFETAVLEFAGEAQDYCEALPAKVSWAKIHPKDARECARSKEFLRKSFGLLKQGEEEEKKGLGEACSDAMGRLKGISDQSFDILTDFASTMNFQLGSFCEEEKNELYDSLQAGGVCHNLIPVWEKQKARAVPPACVSTQAFADRIGLHLLEENKFCGLFQAAAKKGCPDSKKNLEVLEDQVSTLKFSFFGLFAHAVAPAEKSNPACVEADRRWQDFLVFAHGGVEKEYESAVKRAQETCRP